MFNWYYIHTLGGPLDSVARDLVTLFPKLREVGLEVNTGKCEVFASSSITMDALRTFEVLAPGIRVVDRSEFTLLGAPLFLEGVESCLESKRGSLSLLHDKLKSLSSHVALTLLRSCFSMPRLTYVVRTAPTWFFPQCVTSLDNLLRETLESVLNVGLDETQWCQATLPVRHGGLGVRRVEGTGLAAFLASIHGVADLVTQILPDEGDGFEMPFMSEALSAWGVLCPSETLPQEKSSQRCWDDVHSRVSLNLLMESAVGRDLARLRAASKPESGTWLHALPSPHLGTQLDDGSLRVAAALRLGCAICEPHRCVCGSAVEANGLHGLSCVRSAGRFSRHHSLNDIIRRALVSAGVPCVLEPPGLSRCDGKRPDGLTLIPWEKGRCLLWDATCCCTFAASHLSGSVQCAGSAAESSARMKHTKYATLKSTYLFVPVALETAGTWATEAKKFIFEIGRRLRQRGFDYRSGSYLVQRISLAIQRGNAASIMGTFGRDVMRGGLLD